MSKLILASKSPRRRELLKLLGHPFQTAVSRIDENLIEGETPAQHVVRLSEQKARDIGSSLENGIVIRSKNGAFSILETRKDFIQDNKQIYTVITVLLPENFDQNAREITKALELFSQNRSFKKNFLSIIILFYTYFSLPPSV